MKYSFTKIKNIDDASWLKQAWQDLHKNADHASIYNSYEFISSSLASFHSVDYQPYILLIHIDTLLVGIFFLESNIEIKTKAKLRLRIIESTAQQEIDKPYPIIHQLHSTEVWRSFFSYLSKNDDWDLFRLYELDTRLQANILDVLPKKNIILRINKDKTGPTINLKKSWQEYLLKHKKMRKKISRLKNKNENISFKLFENSNEALTIYKTIEEKSWKSGNIGITKTKESENFYESILQSISENENLSIFIGILYIDGTPISGEIAYTCFNKVYFCHGCYDNDFSTYSPGMISTAYFIQNFMEKDYQQGDFLCGYAGYLDAWSDHKVSTNRIEIYNKTLTVRAFFIIRSLKKCLSFFKIKALHD